MDKDLEKEVDKTVWEDSGVIEALKRSEPCPWQGNLDGTLYCETSDVSFGRCKYNTGKPILVPRAEDDPEMPWRQYRSKTMRATMAFANRAGDKAICNYRSDMKEKSLWRRLLGL
ncbi:MAG TPA: hypothetical protein VJG90_03285 [Candidatus Nanoarchaeia archaeon]|nr:hypothetical protein [Candidatus Nanoarchaeia archaeon]